MAITNKPKSGLYLNLDHCRVLRTMTNIVSTSPTIDLKEDFVKNIGEQLKAKGITVTQVIRLDSSKPKQGVLLYTGDPHPESYCALAIPSCDRKMDMYVYQVVVLRNYQLAHLAKKFLQFLD